MVGNFFPFLDVTLGDDIDPATTIEGLAVWPTGVVGVTGCVVAWTTIDIPFGIHVEHVTVITEITLTRWDPLTDVFDDGGPFLDGSNSK